MEQSFTDQELLEAWDAETDLEARDGLVKEMERRRLFPSESQDKYESTSGAYPDVRDPQFLDKLLARREYAESKQTTWQPAAEDTTADAEFEITPVQRFCANFMSPRTPYQSALLYHGVGVGKTCAAIQIAENWLTLYPRKKVIILAPRNIKAGFERTIFSMDRVTIPEGEDHPNRAVQCTGSSYLTLTNTVYEKNPKRIQSQVEAAIRRRYVLFGYLAFANYVEGILKAAGKNLTDESKREAVEAQAIRREFSGRLLIIDEAHNIKELPTAGIGATEPLEDEDVMGPGGEGDQKDAAAGKKLTPFLDKVLRYAEGMKVVMMTATPMYNSYREIIFLLNLLLKNDKQAPMREQDIFAPNGDFRPEGERRLGYVAQRYVSFMRGENPVTFPIRLFPAGATAGPGAAEALSQYPQRTPRGGAVPIEETIFVENLPLVPTELEGEPLAAVREFSAALSAGEGGISSIQLDKIIQAGNLVVPNPPGEDYDYKQRTEITALSLHFETRVSGGEIQWHEKYEGAAAWLSPEEIGTCAPKYKAVMESVRRAEGVCFIYTRYVNAGAIPLALALEAAGYTPYGRRTGLLAGAGKDRICSRCGERESAHPAGQNHPFNAAKYILLTGDETISPRNAQNIAAEGQLTNKDGDQIKLVIGSQVASEGVDLKFIREIHVIDPWFHLNKTEQILGRGIRFRSHMALPAEKRNTTIYLHVGVRPRGDSMESGDLYSYRVAFRKGQQMGRVNRVLKRSAVDCNLNHDAILINNAMPVRQIDSQGVVREKVPINDQPFTAVCDWLDTCDYKCSPDLKVDVMKTSDVTYDAYAMRWREAQLKKRLRNIFAAQAFYRAEYIWELFADIPRMALTDMLMNVVGNKAFVLERGGREGYLIYRNGYYLFQPMDLVDTGVPIALRVARLPVKRDVYLPGAVAAGPAAAPVAGEEGVAIAAAPGEPVPEVKSVAAEGMEPAQTAATVAAWNRWIAALARGDTAAKIPDAILVLLHERSGGNQKEYTRRMQRYEMFPWVAIAMEPWTAEKSAIFRQVGEEFFWDEELEDGDRERAILAAGPADAMPVMKHHYLSLPTAGGAITLRRIYSAIENTIQVLCSGPGTETAGGEDGRQSVACPASILDLLQRDTTGRIDPLRALKVDTEKTGTLYGFVVPKRGSFIFKTNKPPVAGKKLSQGEDIGNQSMMSGHHTKMEILGSALRAAGKDTIGMTAAVFKGERRIVNATRAAAAIDIVLRIMDKEHIGGRRWFYRALEAIAVGHRGEAQAKA
jgi:hypothetical protein